MKRIIKEKIVDCSDQDSFCFSLICVDCGRVWKSTPIRFSKAGGEPSTEAKLIIAQALYRREHAQALERAISEAMHHFNICPLCGSLVCDGCFIICNDLDMCRSCSNQLQEQGECVLPGSLLMDF
ncbi:MAG: hypothetical protein Q4B50_06390 [Bacillota bacterium]|nr:hypothetical protein [Bacillota bacterium]